MIRKIIDVCGGGGCGDGGGWVVVVVAERRGKVYFYRLFVDRARLLWLKEAVGTS